jgi:hypothetical protein
MVAKALLIKYYLLYINSTNEKGIYIIYFIGSKPDLLNLLKHFCLFIKHYIKCF